MNPWVGVGALLGALLLGGYLGYKLGDAHAEKLSNAFYKAQLGTQEQTIAQLRGQLVQRANEEQTKVLLLKDALKLEQDKSLALRLELTQAQSQYDDLQEEIARANLSHPADSSVLDAPDFQRLYNDAARAAAAPVAAAGTGG